MEPYKKILAQRRAQMHKAEKMLFALVSKQQKTLLRQVINKMRRVLSIRGGIISQGEQYDDILRSAYFQTTWERLFGAPVGRLFETELKKLLGLNAQYFERYFPSLGDAVPERIAGRFLRVSQSFVNSYKQTNEVAAGVKRLVLAAIQRGDGFAELENSLKKAITPTDGYGISENYSFYKTRIHDTFSEYDRAVQNEYGTELKLNYCIYAGGEIEQTRPFCEERNNKVFKREEVLSWQNLEWQGKKSDHRILIDCGGYNCRHFYNWISYETAVRIKPGLTRSTFDNNLL